MQISSQLSRFMNSNNNHCDLDFSLTVCDILGWPYRGHEAVSEDPMLKRGVGVCGPTWPWCEEWDESAVGAGRRRMYKAAAISSAPLHPHIFFRFITSHNNPVRESL
jgi:hypothetical protein